MHPVISSTVYFILQVVLKVVQYYCSMYDRVCMLPVS
jgi:hypothetical protein